MPGTNVFICYSHRDESWKNLLLDQLAQLEEEALLEIWNDRMIKAGDVWMSGIFRAIDRSAIAVLLITGDFLRSNFINEEEIPRLLEREAQEGLRIVPLLIHDCNWQQVDWLQRLQLRPVAGIPLSAYAVDERDRALQQFVSEIKDLRDEHVKKFRLKLRRYLETVKFDAERVPPYFPKEAKLTHIRVKVKVSKKGALASILEARNREQILQAPPSNAAHYHYRMNSLGLKSSGLANLANDRDEKIYYWDQEVRDKLLRGVVVGDPGFGKSWLLRWETVRLAQDAIQGLDNGQEPANLVWPVPLRLFDIANTLAVNGTAFSEALTGLLRRFRLLDANTGSEKNEHPDEELIGFLRKRIGSRNAVLLLDALDEVPQGELRSKMLQVLDEWVKKSPDARLIVTSRHSNYQAPWSNIRQTPEEREVELLPFDDDQISNFIEAWFGDDFESADKMRQMIRDSPQLRGMAELPLLLGFLCSLFNHEHRGDAVSLLDGASIAGVSRSRLYEAIVDSLLLRVWDQAYPEHRNQSPQQRTAILNKRKILLEELAFRFFMEDKAQFSYSELETALSRIVNQHKKGDAPLLKAEDTGALVRELSEVRGVLIEGGRLTDFNLQFLFLHLTVQEYLSAAYLGRIINKNGWRQAAVDGTNQLIKDLIAAKSWDGRWEQILLLLSGTLDDPLPLLDLLSDETTDDLFLHRAALAVHCLGEAWLRSYHSNSKAASSLELIREKLAKRVYENWLFHAKRRTGALSPHLQSAVPVLIRLKGRINGAEIFDKLSGLITRHDSIAIENAAANILSKARNELVSNPGYVEQLLGALMHTQRQDIREKLTDVLSELSVPLFRTGFFPDMLARTIDNADPKRMIVVVELLLNYLQYSRDKLAKIHDLKEQYVAAPDASLRRSVSELIHQSKAIFIFCALMARMNNDPDLNDLPKISDIENIRRRIVRPEIIDSPVFEQEDADALDILSGAVKIQDDLFGQKGAHLQEVFDTFEVNGVKLKDLLLDQLGDMKGLLRQEEMWQAFLAIVTGMMDRGGLGTMISASQKPEELIGYAPTLLQSLAKLIECGQPELQINALEAITSFNDEKERYIRTEEQKKNIEEVLDEIKITVANAMEKEKNKDVLMALAESFQQLTSSPEDTRQKIINIQHLYQQEDAAVIHAHFRDFFNRMGNPVANYDTFLSAHAASWLRLDPDKITSEEELEWHLINDPTLVDTLLEIFFETRDIPVKAGIVRMMGGQKTGDYKHEIVLDCIEEGLASNDNVLLASSLDTARKIGKSIIKREKIVAGILKGIRQNKNSDYAVEACRVIRVLADLNPDESVEHHDLLVQITELLLSVYDRTDDDSVRTSAAASLFAFCEPRFRVFKIPHPPSSFGLSMLFKKRKPQYAIHTWQSLSALP